MALDSPARRGLVGVPVHEAALTSAVISYPDAFVSSNPTGHAIVVLEEVELGIGRPDIIVLTADLKAVALRRAAGLRLRNLTEARALGALLGGHPESSGVSPKHFHRLSDRLVGMGWLDWPVSTRVISDSLLIEAKVSHWGRGIEQLARVRWATHRAALLVPDEITTNIPAAMLAYNALGLLAQGTRGLRWRRDAPRSEPPLHVDAWLGELIARAVEG